MKNLKLKFWDTDRKMMLESNVSCVTAYRNYLDVAAETRFSDCNNQAEQNRYIPILLIGKDNKGTDIYTGDKVLIDLNNIYDKDLKVECEITYDENECCFCAMPTENNEHFITMPLFGIMSEVQKIGNKYEISTTFKTKPMNYELIITQIKAGKLPSLIGCRFSQLQIDEMDLLLKNRDYFDCEVKSRLDPGTKLSDCPPLQK